MKPFWPVDMQYQIFQRWMENPQNYPNRGGHPGLDFRTPKRKPWYAVWDGDITAAAYRKAGGYGREIFLKVLGRWCVIYGHADELLVRVGEHVERGQLIGYSGGGLDDPQRGNSKGEHTHFEVRDLLKPQVEPLIGAVDPEIWLATDLDTTAEPDTPKTNIRTVVTDYINIRRDPSTNKPSVGKVLYGMDLDIIGDKVNGFYPVKLWISDGNGEYLE